jgi:lipopolysaccharide/colanic/teichoic acid biosynthesis glycosyltransferase
MFSHHPFTLEHRYSLDASATLPAWKRVLDLMCCVVGLPILGFLTFGFTVIAALFSRGPIFFRQENIGYLGRRFGVYRFRTMHVLSHDSSQGSRAVVHPDSALMPGGRFLRSTGLADLPQLVNVFRGEMTIVGPRPGTSVGGMPVWMSHRPDKAAVPGMTGPWRFGHEQSLNREHVIHWERDYTEHHSFVRDLGMIIRSVFAMISGRMGR